MAENSAIEWTHHTFNPWRGCTKISPGCTNCYAETLSHRNPKTLGVWGPNGKRIVAAEAAWKEPLKWNRKAMQAGERHRVFCASLADVFEDWQGRIHTTEIEPETKQNCVAWYRNDIGVCRAGQTTPGLQFGERLAIMDDVRLRLLKLIVATPHLDWLLLTKRPEHINKILGRLSDRLDHYEATDMSKAWMNRVWLGVSCEDQKTADERIPLLLKTPATVRFLSCEPLLGPVDFSDVTKRLDVVKQLGKRALNGIDWVIVGGESGHGARPCNIAWVRSIVEQCRVAGVACFVKQLGAHVVGGGDFSQKTGCMEGIPLRDKKGGDPAEWPEGLRVREWPCQPLEAHR